MLIDEARLRGEHRMLARLTIGMVSEGVRVLRVIPDALDDDALLEADRKLGLIPRIETATQVVPWLRRARLEQLIEATDRPPTDLIYVSGEAWWAVGLELGRARGCPVAIDVWNVRQCRRAPRGHAAGPVAAYVATSAALARNLRQRVDPDLVSIVPPGVPIPRDSRRGPAAGRDSIGLAIIGTGEDLASFQPMLRGLARLRDRSSTFQAFMALEGTRSHEVWRLVREAGLLECVSMLGGVESYRSLLAECDALVLPERMSGVPSIVLESMACGLPVFAVHNEHLEILVPEQTGVIIDQPTADRWGQELERLLTQPLALQKLGSAAAERVASTHASHQQVERLLGVFQQIIQGDALAFPADPA